jgi:hypothetical protein
MKLAQLTQVMSAQGRRYQGGGGGDTVCAIFVSQTSLLSSFSLSGNLARKQCFLNNIP